MTGALALLLAAAAGAAPASCGDEPPALPSGPPPASRPAPGGRASSTLALSPDGRRLAAVDPDSGSLALLDAATLSVTTRVAVGADPRLVSVDPSGRWAWVAARGSGALARVDMASGRARIAAVGGRPYGVVAGERAAYASDFDRWEVLRVDPATMAVTSRAAVAPFPAGLALTGDGRVLLVVHQLTAAVTALDARTLRPLGALVLPPGSGQAEQLALSPDGARLYVPHLRANPERELTSFDDVAFGALAVFDLERRTPPARAAFGFADEPAPMPLAAAVAPDGRAYVADAAGDQVVVTSPGPLRSLARLRAGAHPRGLALSPDGARLYVHHLLDGTVAAWDLRAATEVARATTGAPSLSGPALRGRRLFHSARGPMSRQGWVACASCHLDGFHDGRTWRGLPDAPRNTPALAGSSATAPYHWTGDFPRLQDVQRTIRAVMGGEGITGPQLDELAAYMSSLPPPVSPCLEDGRLSTAAARGAASFAGLGCAACHAAPAFTDGARHDVGTGRAFDTPSLAGLWATAPYLHDGRARALREVFVLPGRHELELTKAELDDLLAYLRSL